MPVGYNRRYVKYIKKNFAQKIALSEMAKQYSVSQEHLSRIFKKETGYAPNDYKNRLRIERAKIMLFNEISTIDEISVLLGFENTCYFSRIFKKQTGFSPTAYRKQQINL